jgi:hypothetical protein
MIMPQNHSSRWLAALLFSGLAIFVARESHAQTATAIDHHAYRTARFLRFLDADSSPIETAPHIGLAFGDKEIRAVLDSGSTGIVVAAASIPDVDQLPVVGDGRLTYTSSGRIMLGHWVKTRVSLIGQEGGTVKTDPLPVLAVTEVQCLANARDCTPNKSPRGIAMVGVGFGRESDAQSQSTPDKNPLLNITWSDRAFRPGYVLTAKGIRLGLAPSDSARPFLRVKLERNMKGDDWQGAPVCISINREAPPACGSVLVDSGVQDMFMTIPSSQAGNASATFADGTDISIKLGGANDAADFETFTTGGASDIAPRKIYLHVSPDRVFVNTSVRLLNRYDILYDADGGYFGMRPKPARDNED